MIKIGMTRTLEPQDRIRELIWSRAAGAVYRASYVVQTDTGLASRGLNLAAGGFVGAV
jgi:hypothetical protein